MIIGIDDTDSKKGMCTTYICATLIARLKRYGEVSIPRLIRLNPCIPFKTRGNGATSFAINTNDEEKVKKGVIDFVKDMSELEEDETNPGVVFISKEALEEIDEEKNRLIRNFYENAVKKVLRIEDAYKVISKLRLQYFGLKNKRGIIGALAAAVFLFLQDLEKEGKIKQNYDFTYELMAYRKRERWGTPRFIDESSVWEADEVTYPLTWDTVDKANKKTVFAPHSPCPVLFGIRGISIDAIKKAYAMIRAEPVERYTLFITNQGTDFHFIRPKLTKGKSEKLEEYCSYILDGVVSRSPFTIEGGHVVFSIEEKASGRSFDCVAYEPTKGFRNIIRKLKVGDEIAVFGSLKKETINIEKMEIKKLNNVVKQNPKCYKCKRTMESAGRLQGYRCKKCKTHCKEKEVKIVNREIEEGFYEAPPVARRHISKPLIRMQMEEKKEDARKRIHSSR